MRGHRSVGGRLKLAREISTLSAREVDRLAGRAEGHCAIIEAREQETLRTDTLRAYCDALGLRPSWLAFGEGEPPTAEEVRTAVETARALRDAPAFDPSPSHPPQAA